MQDAINIALAQGAVIVVAAGNEKRQRVATSAPANCSGVITVGASTAQGDRASYSNFGLRVDVSAPGGDDGDDADLILSTVQRWHDDARQSRLRNSPPAPAPPHRTWPASHR